MSVIFFLMGKSATGKDGLGQMLLSDDDLSLEQVTIYTTRPMRTGEKNGKEYFFVTVDELKSMRERGSVIEERVYHTVQGDWYYFTCADDRFICDMSKNKKFLVIGTLEAYISYKEYFGEEKVIPLYIEVSDEVRLLRSVERERRNSSPDYKEVCRRFLADEEDFSLEKLKAAGVKNIFKNDGSIDECYGQLRRFILGLN